MKNFLEKKFRRKDQQAEKDKTERVMGLGRRTKEAIVKWNQMTALRFQTGGKTSDIPGLPSGALTMAINLKAITDVIYHLTFTICI